MEDVETEEMPLDTDATKQEEQSEIRPTFFQMYAILPPSLRKRCGKQFLGAIAVALVTMLCAIYFGQWQYCVGFLFSGYIAWVGVDIVRRCRNGRIVYKQMICIRVKKVPMMKGKIIIALREADVPVGDERAVHQYLIPASNRSAALLTENALVNIYFDLHTPSELLAWQVIG